MRKWLNDSTPKWAADWHSSFGLLKVEGRSTASEGASSIWLRLLLHLSRRFPEMAWNAPIPPAQTFNYHRSIVTGADAVRNRDGALSAHIAGRWVPAKTLPQHAWLNWRGQSISLFNCAQWSTLTECYGGDTGLWPTGPSDREVEQLCEAIRLLEALPLTAAWVRRVLRILVLLPSIPGQTMSSSDIDMPSTVRLTPDEDAATTAELLVHECAHIYFGILERETRLINDTDLGRYFSPFRHEERPLRSILLAYHAFVNVAHMYQQFARFNYRPQMMGYRASDLRSKLRVLESVLNATRGLTPAGILLFHSLAPLVQEI